MKIAVLLGVLGIWAASHFQAEEHFQEVNDPIWRFEHDGQTFTNVFLVRVGDSEGLIKIESGLVRVKLSDLPRELREK